MVYIMGFFDKLFGGKAASETKFSGQKMTVMLPIDGKVVLHKSREVWDNSRKEHPVYILPWRS